MSQGLTLPNPLESVKQLVLDAVSSPLTRVMYGHAMAEYFAWWDRAGLPGCGKPATTTPTCSGKLRRCSRTIRLPIPSPGLRQQRQN
jgi:hypothetical protein